MVVARLFHFLYFREPDEDVFCLHELLLFQRQIILLILPFHRPHFCFWWALAFDMLRVIKILLRHIDYGRLMINIFRWFDIIAHI